VAGEIGVRTGDTCSIPIPRTRTPGRRTVRPADEQRDVRPARGDAAGHPRDFQASSGLLGSSLLGGVSFSKVYRIDPYFYYYPWRFFGHVPYQP